MAKELKAKNPMLIVLGACKGKVFEINQVFLTMENGKCILAHKIQLLHIMTLGLLFSGNVYTINAEDAPFALLASYYVFNICYPKPMAPFFTLLEHILLKRKKVLNWIHNMCT